MVRAFAPEAQLKCLGRVTATEVTSATEQSPGYRLVKLPNGAYSVRSLAHHETFHPVVGPVREAEALYVRQLKLADRLQRSEGEFVVWDVGLGAAANAITLLRNALPYPCSVRLVSFDRTVEPMRFALQHTESLDYLKGHAEAITDLLNHGNTEFANSAGTVKWELHLGDFPALLRANAAARWPKPHAIMFDAFSPAKNPEMWTQPLFARVFELLDPLRPCALPTYSRSTMLRVTLLLAGFFVGVGHATGEKEETTIAANSLDLIEEPLDRRWVERVRRSTSAEPMWEPVYRQSPVLAQTWERLQQHPQFV